MDKQLQEAINEQVKNELYSAYIYLSMATYFDAAGLKGCARWMKEQAKEEYQHAMRMYEHLNERGARVVLKALDQPPVDFNSPLDVFAQTLAHEKKVTGMIADLYALANKLDDKAASIMLEWFVKEQVEEESTAAGIVEKIRMLPDSPDSMFVLDSELGKRA